MKVNYRHFALKVTLSSREMLEQRRALGAIVVDLWKDFAISFVRLTFVESRENCRGVEIQFFCAEC